MLHAQSSRHCRAVDDQWPWLPAGAVLQDRPSQEGTTPRATAEDSLVPDTRSGMTEDQGIASGRWISQVFQVDTRL